MVNQALLRQAVEKFRSHYGVAPTAAAYAPGRVEILGNHTDYNQGLVLSAAINFGHFFLAAPAPGPDCRLVAGDLMKEASFSLEDPRPVPGSKWASYVMGVAAQLRDRDPGRARPFLGLFLGDVPLGSGLSSSAALEVSTGLAVSALFGIDVPPIDLARIGQAAEHKYVGVRTGLLDQISSLHGKKDALVMSDFRTLEVRNVPLGVDACFLVCNTHAKHSLVDSAYNERREACERAARFFAERLDHPVSALRDVSPAELDRHRGALDDVTARRASHVIGENDRVLRGAALLGAGRLAEFGSLMYASHASSRYDFENSCEELDALIDASARMPEVLGARLSGGGFGGSAVMLLAPSAVEGVRAGLVASYRAPLRLALRHAGDRAVGGSAPRGGVKGARPRPPSLLDRLSSRSL